MNKEYIKALLKNKDAKKLFQLSKRWGRPATYSDLLADGEVNLMTKGKTRVLYVSFPRAVRVKSKDGHLYTHYLCRLNITDNEFSFAPLHTWSSDEKRNISKAKVAYLFDFQARFDRNMSIHTGSHEVI